MEFKKVRIVINVYQRSGSMGRMISKESRMRSRDHLEADGTDQGKLIMSPNSVMSSTTSTQKFTSF